MKIALIGASGFIGTKILAEALSRDHEVTAIVRHPDKMDPIQGMTAHACDVHDVAELTQLIKGHDVVISAFKAEGDMSKQESFDNYVKAYTAIIAAVKAAHSPRLLVVGGAASLKMADGTEFIDSDLFPAQFAPNKVGILGLREVYYMLHKEEEFDWAFFSPAVIIFEGDRTGEFRWGTDKYFTDEKGESRISAQDYAVAMIDEVETPKHHRTRFTVAY